MKTIIAGSRHIEDASVVEQAILESGFRITCVISGAAKGVDELGQAWAEKNNILIELYPALWDKFGKSAGSKRNEVMAYSGEALIALPCKHSKGTKDMLERARNRGLLIFEKELTCTKK